MLSDSQDALGWEMYDFLNGKTQSEIVERDDGFISTSPTPAAYFAPFESWKPVEQEAIQYAQGRVLDIGCGAGRVGLFLKEKGHAYLGIDNSPRALEVCRQRGLEDVRYLSITQLGSELGIFDTVVMFGNNFGLFGGPQRAKWLLRRFYKLTSPQARILATSTDPYKTEDPAHLAYHERNRLKGRMAGQLRIRIRYRRHKTPWFDYLIVSQDEMQSLLENTGWEVLRFIDEEEKPYYTAILQKKPTLRYQAY